MYRAFQSISVISSVHNKIVYQNNVEKILDDKFWESNYVSVSSIVFNPAKMILSYF